MAVAGQFLEHLSELEDAASALEAFDIMEVLPDVMQVGTSTCEQFVRECVPST